MKNVAYGLVLSAALLTVSGCCNWFSGSCNKNEQAATEETKAVAENEAAAALEATTAVAMDAATQPAAEENATVVTEKVATADAMPMNEVAPATEEKAA